MVTRSLTAPHVFFETKKCRQREAVCSVSTRQSIVSHLEVVVVDEIVASAVEHHSLHHVNEGVVIDFVTRHAVVEV